MKRNYKNLEKCIYKNQDLVHSIFNERERRSIAMTTITTNNVETIFEDGQAFCAYRIETEMEIDEDGYDVEGDQYVLIEKLFVPVEDRGNGIARRLLRECVSHARAAHPSMAIRLVAEPLDASTDMERLVDFYGSEGFEVIEADEIVVMKC